MSGFDRNRVAVDVQGSYVTATLDDIRVELYSIGEGYCEDYDADDPNDRPLLRFYVQTFDPDPTEGGWIDVEDASYCTNLIDPEHPDGITAEQEVNAAILILYRVYDPLRAGESIKKIGEKLSWIAREDVA